MHSKEIQDFIQKNDYPAFEPKAIMFDMDGVLYDSMRNHSIAWQKAFLEVGLEFSEKEVYMNEGRTSSSTIDGVFQEKYCRNATQEEKDKIYKLKTGFFEKMGKMQRMTFALELLEKIKKEGRELYVVTGSGQSNLFDTLNSDFPEILKKENLITAFDVTHGKPHPEPYAKALKKSGFQPWEVLVVENAPLGVESATAAGLFSIAVNTGPLEADILSRSGANVVMPSMKKLYENWSELF